MVSQSQLSDWWFKFIETDLQLICY